MKSINRLRVFTQLSLALALAGLTTFTACAQSGTWINASGGSWPVAANWNGGTIAANTDSTADFSTLALSSAPTVT